MLDPLINFAIFIIWWWMAFLALLPIGVKRVEEADVVQGHDAGAPQQSLVVKKGLWAIGIALILWALTAIFIWMDPFHIRR
ncbi:MAG: DUF1467 family protein [Alphaproteobacteria bacterium]